MSKIKTEFKLPGPKRVDDHFEWLPVVRIGRTVPFGYEQDPEDADILLPIPDELVLLEEAKVHLKRYSSRQVAAWLSNASGRYISHTGLLTRIKNEYKRHQQYANANYLAKRYKEAEAKARKIEARTLGRRTSRELEDSGDS